MRIARARPGEREQENADGDRRIGDVEHRPVPAPVADLDEVHYFAGAHPVDEVADRPTHDEREPHLAHDPGDTLAHEQVEDHRHGGDREQVVGERKARAEAEGDPGVAGVGEAQERTQHFDRVVPRQVRGGPALGPQVRHHDRRGDPDQAQPGADY